MSNMAAAAAAAAAAMASSLLLVLLLVALSLPPLVVLAADADDGTTHLHFFMHDIVAGSNPTAVQVVKGPAAAGSIVPGLAFGDTMVIDDALTETSSPTSAAVGRAQGFYMMSSQSGLVLMVCANLLLTAGDHNGSTLAVVGRDDVAADVRELSVVGGTGKFRMATGYVLWKTSSMSGPDATIELDVHVKTATATTDGGTTAAIGGGATGTGASSGAAKGISPARWVSACVVAVVVAVVGSGVW